MSTIPAPLRCLLMAFGLFALLLVGCTTTETSESAAEPEPSRPMGGTPVDETPTERRLREVNEMLEAGFITAEEAEAKRREILGLTEEPTPAPAPPRSATGSPDVAAATRATAGLSGPIAAQLAGLRAYEAEETLSQRLTSTGSDTMDDLMAEWEEVFKRYHPNIRVSHSGQGSSTAIPALLDGADFGPMSREIRQSEINDFISRFGHPPVQLPVALDALAVYVNPNNPILEEGLTIAEIDAIFSSTRNQGYADEVRTWGDLGLRGRYANQPIRVYGRNAASGTFAFFRENVLDGGDFRDSYTALASSEAVVEAVARDPFGIGYSGIGYKTDDVATVDVAEAGGRYVEANGENALSGNYPLARFLYLTINHDPRSDSVNVLHREFMRFVYSPEGQRIVLDNGYYPVNRIIADQALGALGF